MDISAAEPENFIILKDTFNNILHSHLKNISYSKKDSSTSIKVTYKSINFEPIQYNKNGYVIQYLTKIRLHFTFIKNNKIIEDNIIGNYKFSIQNNDILSNQLKFEAIKNSSEDAIYKFINLYI